MNFEEFQQAQEITLYQGGEIDASHDMHLDLDDMWLGCLVCKASWHHMGPPRGDEAKNQRVLRDKCTGRRHG